jgi:hypothetical protein
MLNVFGIHGQSSLQSDFAGVQTYFAGPPTAALRIRAKALVFRDFRRQPQGGKLARQMHKGGYEYKAK